jgi:hypothetical protein
MGYDDFASPMKRIAEGIREDNPSFIGTTALSRRITRGVAAQGRRTKETDSPALRELRPQCHCEDFRGIGRTPCP